MAKNLHRACWVGLVTLLTIRPIATLAQIAGDSSLGTQVNSSAIAPCTGNCTITDGATRGSNLFHSFRQFSLPNRDTASFVISPSIQNVIVRVTGVGQPFISNINGTIATSSPTNFFLLNPNGIIFGSGATLNIGGAFLATTADQIQFGDRTEFRTDSPAPLLTISAPTGLQFNRTPGAIQMQGTLLSAGSTNRFSAFTLVGGNIILDSSVLIAGQQVELAGVGENSSVGLETQGHSLRVQIPSESVRADVSIANNSSIAVNDSTNNGGNLTIQARNLDISGRSRLIAGVSSGTANRQAGNITLNATDAMQVRGESEVSNSVQRNATGNAGNVNLSARTLSLIEGSVLRSDTNGQGNAGNIVMNVRDRILFDNNSFASSGVRLGGRGNGGNIVVSTGSLSFTNVSRMTVSTNGIGNGGTIELNVRDRAFFDNSYLSGTVNQAGVGNGGTLNVDAGTLELTNGGQLIAETNGQGNGGNILVNVREQVIFDGFSPDEEFYSGVASGVTPSGVGQGGVIDIVTSSLSVTNGAVLFTAIGGTGKAGTIRIVAHDRVFLDGTSPSGRLSAIGSSVTSTGIGNGGDISISTGSLVLSNEAGLISNTDGQGNAGNIFVDARDLISLNNAIIDSSVTPRGNGQGGNIQLSTDSLNLTDGALLNATIDGQGRAGDIQVQATNLEVRNGSQIVTLTEGNASAGNVVLKIHDRITLTGANSGLFANTTLGSTGNGGSITINPRTVQIQDGAAIAVDSKGSGVGGNIRIQAGRLELRDRGSITAEAASAQGGNITLDVRDSLLLRRNSSISTNAGTAQTGGNGGNINLNVSEGFIVGISTENSDITANAFTGRGGRVDVTAQGIYGLQYRSSLTALSDITASSQFGISGNVNLNLLSVDPSRGLAALPVNLTDSSQQISQECSPDTKASTSSFVATGRGGIPLNPNEPLESRSAGTTWVQLPEEQADVEDSSRNQNRSTEIHDRLESTIPTVEAQGWIVNPNGTVELIATVPTTNPARFWTASVFCQVLQGN